MPRNKKGVQHSTSAVSTSSSKNQIHPRNNRKTVTSLPDLDGVDEGSLLSDFTLHQRTDLPLANDDFSRILSDMNKLATLHENLSSQYAQNQNVGRTSRSSYSGSSLYKTDQYAEILSNRGIFTRKLAESVDASPLYGAPRYKAQFYEALTSFINVKLQGAALKADQIAEELKRRQAEIDQIDARNDLFSNLINDDDKPGVKNVPDPTIQLFKEAKADLEYLLMALYPKEEDREKIASVLSLLTEACIMNLDSKEDQYVEIPKTALRNQGVRCMIEGGIIVEHPHNPDKFCFCI